MLLLVLQVLVEDVVGMLVVEELDSIQLIVMLLVKVVVLEAHMLVVGLVVLVLLHVVYLDGLILVAAVVVLVNLLIVKVLKVVVEL